MKMAPSTSSTARRWRGVFHRGGGLASFYSSFFYCCVSDHDYTAGALARDLRKPAAEFDPFPEPLIDPATARGPRPFSSSRSGPVYYDFLSSTSRSTSQDHDDHHLPVPVEATGRVRQGAPSALLLQLDAAQRQSATSVNRREPAVRTEHHRKRRYRPSGTTEEDSAGDSVSSLIQRAQHRQAQDASTTNPQEQIVFNVTGVPDVGSPLTEVHTNHVHVGTAPNEDGTPYIVGNNQTTRVLQINGEQQSYEVFTNIERHNRSLYWYAQPEENVASSSANGTDGEAVDTTDVADNNPVTSAPAPDMVQSTETSFPEGSVIGNLHFTADVSMYRTEVQGNVEGSGVLTVSNSRSRKGEEIENLRST
mmetsp:Transcript_4520/g.11035  ORF Transcript_4520/g.11035 Transcript_4520/m.11035 type:complete len:364 (+) Transcript_4520:108-1199(+)|eukprot:CAMPEP_0178987846 /NCGR_PEP_ID=MMETSP0795-20121207/3494_1 /TAXON_ID=88552 /ORGANISM="Amoebophrya sp., Strain Ameob2" /LENGTH=363 /DNA_ID=CAMNT_0020679079 /DNA_START=87 /DNA_END=1178 /DNA_ORIENTATION=+